MINRIFSILTVLLLAACASDRPNTVASNTSGGKGGFKIGNPYQIKGQWYTPRPYKTYVETGTASWYGAQFHGRSTANGEVFDKHQMTAAHRTLPLPSVVEVTNLNNGNTVRVRVNDRGPFHDNRLIDMSESAADALGFKGAGLASVRVTLLPEESRQAAIAAGASPAMLAKLDSFTTPQPMQTPVLASRQSTGTVYQQAAMQPIQPAIQQQTYASVIPPAAVNNDRPLFVQAGAFSIAQNAHRFAGTIASIDKAVVQPASINGQPFYRVRFGPYQSLDEARAVQTRVAMAGHPEAKVILE